MNIIKYFNYFLPVNETLFVMAINLIQQLHEKGISRVLYLILDINCWDGVTIFKIQWLAKQLQTYMDIYF